MKTKLTILICCLAATGLLAACGGGGDDNGGGDSGSALTKQEFDTQADQICKDGQAKVAQVQQKLQAEIQKNPAAVQTAIQDVVDQVVPVVRDTLDKIAALNPPAELQSKLDEFISKANAAVDQLEKDPASAASGSNAFKDLEPLATDLGIQNCGQTG